MSNWEKYLKEIYLDPSHPASFGSPERLYKMEHFYQKELQKVEVSDDDIFKIEKVIKYKGRGNKKEALVCWLGWPKQFHSWIPVSNLNNNE